MSWFVADWSLLHFELKHNYHPKAQAPMTPRLSDPWSHTSLPYRTVTLWSQHLGKRYACLFIWSDWTSSNYREVSKLSHCSFLRPYRVKKRAGKGLKELVWSYSALGSNIFQMVGSGEQPGSSQLCLSCNSPTVPLSFCTFRSGESSWRDSANASSNFRAWGLNGCHSVFSGLTFQTLASAEIIGGLFLWFTLFCKTLEVGDVAKGKRLVMINSNEPENHSSETLCELEKVFFFFKCDKRSGTRQHQGCTFIRVLLLSFADKILRFRFVFFCFCFLNIK